MTHVPLRRTMPAVLILAVLACVSTVARTSDHAYVSVENMSFWDANVWVYCDGALRKRFSQVDNKATARLRLGRCTSIDVAISLIGKRGTYPLEDIRAVRPGDTLFISVGTTLPMSTYWVH